MKIEKQGLWQSSLFGQDDHTMLSLLSFYISCQYDHTQYIYSHSLIFYFFCVVWWIIWDRWKKNIWWIDYSVAFTRYVNHFSPLNTIFFFFIRLFLLIYFISTYQLHHYLPTWFPPLSSLKSVYFPFCFHLIPEFLW